MTSIASADISRLSRALRRSGEQADATTKNTLIEAANYILSEMEIRVPVDTGKLRDSLGVRVEGNRVLVGADPVKAPYAIYVEQGTRPHEIRPKGGGTLAFRVNGQMVFAKKVNHPGTKAQPFIEPAFRAWVDSLGTMAAEANVRVIGREAARGA